MTRKTGSRCLLPLLSMLVIAITSSSAVAGTPLNTWTAKGLNGQTITALAIDPVTPSTLYATADRGVFKSTDGASSWTAIGAGLPNNLATSSVISLAIDPANPARLYAGTYGHVYKSLNEGSSWASVNSGLTSNVSINALAIDPKTPATLYAGGTEQYGCNDRCMFKSTDGGAHWFGVGPTSLDIASLVIDPQEPATFYAATYASSDVFKSGVFKSTDAGINWSAINVGLPYADVSALAVDPSAPATLYAGTSTIYSGTSTSRIFKSTNGGGTWTAINTGLVGIGQVRALTINFQAPNTLYAGTDVGVFRSSDSGDSWTSMNTGLTNTNVVALAIDPTNPARLYAGTYGGGVFEYVNASRTFDISVAADGSTRFYSFDTRSGHLVLGNLDSVGKTALSQPYGPYNGWTPRASADGDDGQTRILWAHQDGSAALWLAGPLGVQASFRYAGIAGLTATDVAAGSGTHILWTGGDGSALLQTIDASGAITKSLPLGNYTGWSATAIADGPDGLTRILWNNTDGRAGLSLVTADGRLATSRYAPDAASTALDVAVGGDGLTRVLRRSEDGRTSLWVLNSAGDVITRGPLYPPPAGMVPSRLAAGPDGSARVLFNSLSGAATLWKMSSDGVFLLSVSIDAPVTVPGQLADVSVTLKPMSSPYTHAFTVHIEVREKRGVGISATYRGMYYRGSDYNFPSMESGIDTIRIPAGGVGSTDILVEAVDDVPCSTGLNIVVRIRSDDGLTEDITNTFGCTTGYWPL